jgi:hypothetical protein
MRIAGVWRNCDDGVIRPLLLARVVGPNGSVIDATFFVDSGADRTVLSAALLSQLGGATAPAPSGVLMAGIGGTQAFVQVQATLTLPRTDGGTATVQANFAAFTDAKATDLSILGRDVLNHFDVILSRRRDEFQLLAPPSGYDIHP